MSTYVFSDLHGQYDLWEQIKEFLKPNDKVYFLGDAIDRGPCNIKLLQELLDDSRITFLKGNHEEFIEMYYENKQQPNYPSPDTYKFIDWWDSNGGSFTQFELNDLSDEEQYNLYLKIKNLPLHLKIDNKKGQHFYLSHAGYEPWVSDDEYIWRHKQKCGYPPVENRYTWDRDHFYNTWWEDYFGRVDNEDYMNSYSIHGHTPVQYFTLWKEEPEVRFYGVDSNGVNHKIDLDMGSFDSGKIALFNIDTFEVTYFKRKES